MDPLSQGTLGAIYAQAVNRHERSFIAVTLIGFLAGLLPDIDVLINSKTDPLLFLEYHRQFTHSLIFVPLGGLFSTCLLYFFFKKSLTFKETYLFATIGYLTHAPLDACTTYGTQLFWPFTNYRVSFDFISIIDPLYTLPLLILMFIALKKKKLFFARLAVMYSLFYIGLGFVQHTRAISYGTKIAAARGHHDVHVQAKPSFANLLVWKVIYEYDQTFYVDAVKAGYNLKHFSGESVKKLNIKRDFPWLNEDEVQYKDIQRFTWFSQGFVAVYPEDKELIGDIRYSMVPNKIEPLWGIRLQESRRHLHTPFEQTRKVNVVNRRKLWELLSQ